MSLISTVPIISLCQQLNKVYTLIAQQILQDSTCMSYQTTRIKSGVYMYM